jgi:hypothetical protein
MTEEQIQEIADRVIRALEKLAPVDSGFGLADLGPLAVLVAAVVAGVVGWRTLSQKREADARSEWWKRTQWALEASASKDPAMYAYGAGMLDLLAQSELAGPKDKELLDAVWETGDTGMKDEGITQLIKEASEQSDLTYEEMLSLLSYDEKLAQAFERAKEFTKEAASGLTYEDMVRRLRSGESGSGEPSAAPVDGKSDVRDNESTKEEADG